jgi:menaquinol-cytochrome c reductase iron-sulfur subunit
LAENDPEKTDGPVSGSGGLEKPKPAGYFEGETMTRRAVFTVGGQAAGAAAIGIVTLPLLAFSVAPILETPEEVWEAVGSTDEFAPDVYRPVIITIRAGIGEAGKTTAYVRAASEELGEDPEEEPFVALSTRCAHLGCPVRFVQAAGIFSCPCHGGAYDFEGLVIGGPPVRPLDRFQTRVVDGQVEVGPRYSVTGDLEPVRARDPGEFTGGIWEYLYPPRPSTPPAP